MSENYLQPIVLDAWNAVPDEFIKKLYNIWLARCRAVIEANGSP